MVLLPCFRFVFDLLEGYYVLRLQTFLDFDDGEFYALIFIQVAAAIANNGIKMAEEIFSIFMFNETAAFAIIEPFYDALLFFRHDLGLLS
jgi:hypothetical protein